MAPPVFDIDIRRVLDPSSLKVLTEAEAIEADDEGYLEGNRGYRDLRFWTWEDVEGAIGLEKALIARFTHAEDPAGEEEAFDDERGCETEPLAELWGLDVGVAAAALALSALGAIPVSSCNGGYFGNQHLGKYPYVAFYLDRASPRHLLELAAAADLGLVGHDGLGHLFGQSILDLHRFAEIALANHYS